MREAFSRFVSGMPVNPQSNHSVSYLGKHSRGVDKSRRVMLPAEWRAEDGPTDFMVLLWPARNPEYLLVLPPARWARVLESLGTASLTNDSAAALERFISSNSYSKSLDSYGRLPLPDEAARAVGIEGDAVLLGRFDKFEIWSPDRLLASEKRPETQKAFEALSSLQL